MAALLLDRAAMRATAWLIPLLGLAACASPTATERQPATDFACEDSLVRCADGCCVHTERVDIDNAVRDFDTTVGDLNLEVGSDGVVHLGASLEVVPDETYNVMYAVRDEGEWSAETIVAGLLPDVDGDHEYDGSIDENKFDIIETELVDGIPQFVFASGQDYGAVHHVSREGEGFSEPVRLSDDGDPGFKYGLDVDREGVLHLVYTEGTPRGNVIRYRRRVPGGRWTLPRDLPELEGRNTFDFGVNVHAGIDGRIHVIGADRVPTNGTLRYFSFEPDGSEITDRTIELEDVIVRYSGVYAAEERTLTRIEDPRIVVTRDGLIHIYARARHSGGALLLDVQLDGSSGEMSLVPVTRPFVRAPLVWVGPALDSDGASVHLAYSEPEDRALRAIRYRGGEYMTRDYLLPPNDANFIRDIVAVDGVLHGVLSGRYEALYFRVRVFESLTDGTLCPTDVRVNTGADRCYNTDNGRFVPDACCAAYCAPSYWRDQRNGRRCVWGPGSGMNGRFAPSYCCELSDELACERGEVVEDRCPADSSCLFDASCEEGEICVTQRLGTDGQLRGQCQPAACSAGAEYDCAVRAPEDYFGETSGGAFCGDGVCDTDEPETCPWDCGRSICSAGIRRPCEYYGAEACDPRDSLGCYGADVDTVIGGCDEQTGGCVLSSNGACYSELVWRLGTCVEEQRRQFAEDPELPRITPLGALEICINEGEVFSGPAFDELCAADDTQPFCSCRDLDDSEAMSECLQRFDQNFVQPCFSALRPRYDCALGINLNDTLREMPNIFVAEERRITAETISSTESDDERSLLTAQAYVAATPSYEGPVVLEAIFDVMDENYMDLQEIWEGSNGRAYRILSFGAGGNTFGAVFEHGSATPVAWIIDGDFFDSDNNFGCDIELGVRWGACSSEESCPTGLHCLGRVRRWNDETETFEVLQDGRCVDLTLGDEALREHGEDCAADDPCPFAEGLYCSRPPTESNGYCRPMWAWGTYRFASSMTIPEDGVALYTVPVSGLYTVPEVALFRARINFEDFSRLRLAIRGPGESPDTFDMFNGPEIFAREGAAGIERVIGGVSGEYRVEFIAPHTGDESVNGVWTLVVDTTADGGGFSFPRPLNRIYGDPRLHFSSRGD